MWDDTAITSYYTQPQGQKLVRLLLKQLKKWPVLQWQGREPPAVLALGHAEILEGLWLNAEFEHPQARSSNKYDRIVVMHDATFDEAPDETLNACWREVVPGGLVILVLNNSWSLARWSNKSPLSGGKSYRGGKLNRLIRDAGFTTLDHQTLLPGWPGGKPTWLPLPSLLRVAVLRKDEPAVTRLRLKPLKATHHTSNIATAGN